MHVGAGLDRFPGKIGEFPFDNGKDAKIQREWSRGLGPDTNVKGVEDHSLNALTVPDNVPLPAPAVDYAAIKGCVDALRAGGWGAGDPAAAAQWGAWSAAAGAQEQDWTVRSLKSPSLPHAPCSLKGTIRSGSCAASAAC